MGLRFQRFYRAALDHEYSWLRILLVALVLRLVLLACMAGEPLVSDGLFYHQSAMQIVSTGHLDTYWPPGLPLYEAVVVWLFGSGEWWVRLAMLPWFFWLCRNLYKITYRLHSRVAANIALLLMALYPAMVHQSVEPLTYVPTAALLLALFGQMQSYLEERKSGRLWRAGLLIGTLILFRPSTFIFLLALPPLILLRRRKVLPGLVIASFAALVVGPWIWVVSQQNQRFIPVNDANARNFYLGNNAWTPGYKTWQYGSHWTADPKLPAGFRAELQAIEALPLADQGAAFSRAAWRDIRARPGAFAGRTASRVRTLMAFDTFAGTRLSWSGHPWAQSGYALLGLEALFYVFIGIGFLAFWFSEARRELPSSTLAILLGFIVLHSMPYWFSFSHPTYHLPLLPLIVMPAAVWMQRWLENRGQLPHMGRANAVSAVLAFLLFVGIQVEWVVQMIFITQ